MKRNVNFIFSVKVKESLSAGMTSLIQQELFYTINIINRETERCVLSIKKQSLERLELVALSLDKKIAAYERENVPFAFRDYTTINVDLPTDLAQLYVLVLGDEFLTLDDFSFDDNETTKSKQITSVFSLLARLATFLGVRDPDAYCFEQLLSVSLPDLLDYIEDKQGVQIKQITRVRYVTDIFYLYTAEALANNYPMFCIGVSNSHVYRVIKERNGNACLVLTTTRICRINPISNSEWSKLNEESRRVYTDHFGSRLLSSEQLAHYFSNDWTNLSELTRLFGNNYN